MKKIDINSNHHVVNREIASVTMIKHLTILCAVCLSVTGCATGQSGYSCSGVPEGVQCHNARDVLESSKNTDGPVTNANFHVTWNGIEAEKKNRKARNGNSDAVVNEKNGSQRTAPQSYTPTEEDGALPLRAPSRIMRIWYAPWETATGDLHISKIVFTEVEARRWTIGNNAPINVIRDITPLDAEPATSGQLKPSSNANNIPGMARDASRADVVSKGTKPVAPATVPVKP